MGFVNAYNDCYRDRNGKYTFPNYSDECFNNYNELIDICVNKYPVSNSCEQHLEKLAYYRICDVNSETGFVDDVQCWLDYLSSPAGYCFYKGNSMNNKPTCMTLYREMERCCNHNCDKQLNEWKDGMWNQEQYMCVPLPACSSRESCIISQGPQYPYCLNMYCGKKYDPDGIYYLSDDFPNSLA